jgi:hypothetical protein
MPLFKCTGCGCIDNTACGGNYWLEPLNAKCSECFTGKWEAPFPKETPEQKGLIVDPHHGNGRFYASPKNIAMVAQERAKLKEQK